MALGIALSVPAGLGLTAGTAAADPASACGAAGVRDTSLPASPGLLRCDYGNRGTNGFGGSSDTFTVPADTTKLHIVLNGSLHSGFTEADLAVTPGQVLQINVGGFGEGGSRAPGHRPNGGWNGGGPGGTDGFGCINDFCGGGGDGEIDVRTGSYGVLDRVLVDGAAGGDAVGDSGVGGGLVGASGKTEDCDACLPGYEGFGQYGNQQGGGHGGGNAVGGSFGGGGQGGDGAPTIGKPAIGGSGGGAGWYGGGGGSGRVYGGCCLIYLKGSGGGGSGHAGSGTSNVTLTKNGGTGREKHVSIQSIPAPYATTTTVTSSLNPSVVGQSVTFTATVTTAGPSYPLGGGKVQLTNNYTGLAIFAAVPLTISPGTPGTGTATFTTSALAERNYQVVAAYDGFTDPAFTTVASNSDLALVQAVKPKSAQAITFTSTAPTTAVYGGGTYTVAATGGESGNPVTFASDTPTVCTVDGATVRFVGAGTCSINADQAESPTHLAAPRVVQTVPVGKAAATVTAGSKQKVYGAADPLITATTTGLIGSDTLQGVACAAANPHTSVGTYAITCSGGVNANYDISYVAGTLTVAKAVIAVKASNATRVYGAANPTLAATTSGFVNNDTAGSAFTGAPALSTTATVASHPGAYPITPAAGTLASANYTFTFADGSLAVTQGTLAVVAKPVSFTGSVLAGKMTFSATATNKVSGAPAPGLNVTFTVRTTLGRTVTCTGTTSSSGIATCASNDVNLLLTNPFSYSVTTAASADFPAATATGAITLL